MLLQRIGHRGAFLLFLAFLDATLAYSLLTVSSALVVHMVLPVTAWAWIWAATGAVCLARAAAQRDRVAFAVAAGTKTAWAGASAYAWLEFHVPTGWVATVIWLAFALTVLLISSWPEPPHAGPPPGVPQ